MSNAVNETTRYFSIKSARDEFFNKAISYQTIYKLIQDGFIPVYRVRDRILIAEGDLRAYMDSARQQGRP